MSFNRFASSAALLAAAANLGYSISFLVVRPDNPDVAGTAASAFLLAGGLLAIPPLLAVYRRLSARQPDFALLALALGLVGAFGAAIHGGYDLANAINPPGDVGDFPNQIDPRGLLTFGVSGLAALLIAWLITTGEGVFPARLGQLAGALGALLLIVYVGRLVVLDADSVAIVVPAALAGFIVSPAWYASLGLELRRAPSAHSGQEAIPDL